MVSCRFSLEPIHWLFHQPSTNLHQGAQILTAVLHELRPLLRQARLVVLGGCSAGGRGAFYNLEPWPGAGGGWWVVGGGWGLGVGEALGSPKMCMCNRKISIRFSLMWVFPIRKWSVLWVSSMSGRPFGVRRSHLSWFPWCDHDMLSQGPFVRDAARDFNPLWLRKIGVPMAWASGPVKGLLAGHGGGGAYFLVPSGKLT